MKFISYEGAYFRPEAVAMVSEDQDNEKECIVHLFGGQKIFLPRSAEFTANFIADVANGEIEADRNTDGVTCQMDWHTEDGI